jgi:hypothetical protein
MNNLRCIGGGWGAIFTINNGGNYKWETSYKEDDNCPSLNCNFFDS